MISRHSRARWTSGAALLGAAVMLAASTTSIPANADDDSRPTSARHPHQDGTLRGVMDHMMKLEEIGDRHDGRASGTPGYKASVNYVVRRLERAGYKPRKQAFDFPFFRQTAPSTFEQTEPTAQTWEEDVDYALMTYSGSGDATAPVQGVDLNMGELDNSTSGCTADDFAGFTSGNIALIRRGGCTFADKVVNAQDAGAVGVIIFNTGTEGATDAFAGTLGGPVGEVPAIGTSFAIGEQLATTEGAVVHLATSTVSEIRETWNVTAQTRKGNKDNIVMAGAHLDSVLEGNGINDNGSGSAALLEVAEAIADGPKPNNKVRFAWWGAEELGLLGSEHYVAQMAENRPAKFQNIALYLNFDMVSSPNYILGVYDGNNNSFPPEESADAPEGSAAIERLFHRFFDKIGTDSVDTAFSGRSDYGPFIALNVPAGGLFTGAEGIKTAEEQAMFGGTAGEPYDECYHAACDDLGNVNRAALKANTAAIWHAVKRFARTTKAVNGDSTGHEPPAEPAPRQAARSFSAHEHDHGHAVTR